MAFRQRMGEALWAEDISRKRDDAQNLMVQLINAGLQPAEVNSTVSEFLKTGQVRIPTQRTQMLPADPESGVSSRSTQAPVSFGKPKTKKGLFSMNQATGKFTDVSTGGAANPGLYDDFEVVDYDPRDKNRSGSGDNDPRIATAKATIEDYKDAVKKVDSDGNPVPVPQELVDSAKNAAAFLGIPTEEIETQTVQKPGWFKRTFFDAKPTTTTTKSLPSFRFDGKKKTEFDTEEEALAAGLPLGTIVKIRGKGRARID